MKKNIQIKVTTLQIAKIYTVDLFINACCETCKKDAPNRIAYFIRSQYFYGNYRTYCQLYGLPIADFDSVITHVKKTFEIYPRKVYRNDELDLEILGIILRHSPLRRKKNELKNYRSFSRNNYRSSNRSSKW